MITTAIAMTWRTGGEGRTRQGHAPKQKGGGGLHAAARSGFLIESRFVIDEI